MPRHAIATPTLSARAGKMIASTAMNVLALVGVLCIVLVILAFTANITLIMFKTGSMSPGIPTGSVAVVQQIPAHEIAVGDVVTVDRQGDLPVTHRVTTISDTEDSSSDARTITMRGDANTVDDPYPYTVETVRKVLFSVPGVAPVIVWFAQPIVLGGITIAAGVLVMVAFWPKKRHKTHPLQRKHGHSTVRQQTRSAAGSSQALIFAVIIGAVMSWIATEPAQAMPQESVRYGSAVVFTSISDPEQMNGMLPEVPVYWQLGIQKRFPQISSITVEASAAGDEKLGLRIRAFSCTERWIGTHCPAEQGVSVSAGPEKLGAGYFPVGATAGGDMWLLYEATIPESGTGAVDLTTRITSVSEEPNSPHNTVDEISPTSALGTGLTSTGQQRTPWLPMLGLVALGGGLTLAGLAKLIQIRAGQASPIH